MVGSRPSYISSSKVMHQHRAHGEERLCGGLSTVIPPCIMPEIFQHHRMHLERDTVLSLDSLQENRVRICSSHYHRIKS